MDPATRAKNWEEYSDLRWRLNLSFNPYRAVALGDDTVHFLSTFFEYLPHEGRRNFQIDVNACLRESDLANFADRLEDEFLRPLLIMGLSDGPQEAVDIKIYEACHRRDGASCVLTKSQIARDEQSFASSFARILPGRLGIQIGHQLEEPMIANIRKTVRRYFPSVQFGIGLPVTLVNTASNILTVHPTHKRAFQSFRMCLDHTDTPGQFWLRNYPDGVHPGGVYGKAFTLKSNAPEGNTEHVPEPDIPSLHFHASICRILGESQRGNRIRGMSEAANEFTARAVVWGADDRRMSLAYSQSIILNHWPSTPRHDDRKLGGT